MLVENCKYDLNATIELQQKPKNITLTVFSNVLDKFFETNVIHTYKNNKEDLEGKILTLKNIDFKFNKKKVIISLNTQNKEQ